MFAAERIRKIKELLLEYKAVDVNRLSDVLSVSEATIRRDLEKLEAEGFLTRNYGGAVLNRQVEAVQVPIFPETERLEEKKAIARIAARLVEHNDTIFIGSGSTCLCFAGCLPDKMHLTVVTNSLSVAGELAHSKHLRVVTTGGDLFLYGGTLSMAGDFAHAMLRQVHIDKAFFSVDGVDLHHGYTVNSTEQANLLRCVSEVSEEGVLLCDAGKFDRKCFIRYAGLSRHAKVVTGQEIPAAYKTYFYEHNIAVYTSYDIEW